MHDYNQITEKNKPTLLAFCHSWLLTPTPWRSDKAIVIDVDNRLNHIALKIVIFFSTLAVKGKSTTKNCSRKFFWIDILSFLGYAAVTITIKSFKAQLELLLTTIITLSRKQRVDGEERLIQVFSGFILERTSDGGIKLSDSYYNSLLKHAKPLSLTKLQEAHRSKIKLTQATNLMPRLYSTKEKQIDLKQYFNAASSTTLKNPNQSYYAWKKVFLLDLVKLNEETKKFSTTIDVRNGKILITRDKNFIPIPFTKRKQPPPKLNTVPSLAAARQTAVPAPETLIQWMKNHPPPKRQQGQLQRRF